MNWILIQLLAKRFGLARRISLQEAIIPEQKAKFLNYKKIYNHQFKARQNDNNADLQGLV